MREVLCDAVRCCAARLRVLVEHGGQVLHGARGVRVAAAERAPAAAMDVGSAFDQTKKRGSSHPEPLPQLGTRVLSSL